MSSALAIAGVTAVLVDLLNNGLIDHNVTASVGDVAVSALPPDRILARPADERSQLNLFMYMASPNAGWRNVGLPALNQQGNRVSNPPLALDLHYLLTAYGAKDFHAEILLGYGMQLLHETPVLTRDAIRRALSEPTPVDTGGGLPPTLRSLAASGLADQVEQIKISVNPLGTEELSKLWSGFQTNYRPTAAYLASVVLIEGRRSTRSALPIRAPGLHIMALRQGPAIEHVVAVGGADQPIVAGSSVAILGKRLRGDLTTVLVGGVEMTPAPENLSDTRISLPLPPGLPAGLQGAQVIHQVRLGQPPVPHRGAESNLAAFVLRPTITATHVSNVHGTGTNPRTADIRLDVTPTIGAAQRVVLLLNERAAAAPAAYSFVAAPRTADTSSITVPVSGVMAAEYLVRVQVDGAESPLVVDTVPSSPSFNQYVGPKVTIP